MGNKAIQKQPGPVPAPAGSTSVTTAEPPRREEVPHDRPVRKPLGLGWQILHVLASLRLTVFLFVLSMILVFYGTVAQIDRGVWTIVERYFRSFIVFIPLQLNVQVAQVFFGVPAWVKIPGSILFPGGWTIGGLLLINLLAAHAVRLRISWARGGVLLLHAGLILLLLGELATGLFSQEGQMALANGETSNLVIDSRKAELAVIDTSDPKVDDVVAVPASLLRSQKTVANADLPFDIVLAAPFMVNSDLAKLDPQAKNAATAGAGLTHRAVELPEVSGTNTEQTVDIPSAYITLWEKGGEKELGTYLVSAHLKPQPVEVDGKTYEIALRFKHVYKPYRIELIAFDHDRFPGVEKAKNFSSRVRVIYPERNENHEVVISMNNPLRLIVDWSSLVPQVDTLFQSSFLPGDQGTILQVVDNRSWMMPYISCTMVTFGLLWHFGLMLPVALSRARQRAVASSAKTHVPAWAIWTPAAAAAIMLVFFLYTALPPRDPADGLHLQAFGRLPIQEGGRVQPIDTLARNTLMMLNDRTEFYEEQRVPGEGPKPEDRKEWVKRPAIVWLLDVMSSSTESASRPYFQVPEEIASLIELAPTQTGLHSLRDITKAPGAQRLPQLLKGAHSKPAEKLDPIEKMALDLAATIRRFQELDRYLTPHRVFRIENLDVQALLGLAPREGYRYAITEFAARLGDLQKANIDARTAEKRDPQRVTPYQKQVMKTWNKVGQYIAVANYPHLLMIPPLSEPTNEHWYNWDSFPEGAAGEEKAATALFQCLEGYQYTKVPKLKEQGTKLFNQGVEAYQQLLADTPIPAAKTVGLEQHFNKMAPFYQCLIAYALAMLLVIVGWLVMLAGEKWVQLGTVLCRSAFWILVVTVVVHTLAILTRMYLQGRPPVTNLYSSAIFIGWGCVLLGLFLDMVYRTSFGTFVGAVFGFGTCIIANLLASTGDTLEMMQAVLDTNFWLATHVTAVTMGYMATIVAGGLAIAYLAIWLQAELTDPNNNKELRKNLSTMIYGVVCFATLLSFVGTVLGGIWADQSWGRFWGWDPKENGAILIVVWNALILHARWAGMVKATGVAALAVVGNMITVWSWFGTNQLGVGLHAYGFSNTLAMFCVVMWVSHLAVLALLAVPSLLRMFEVLPPKAS